MSLSQMTFVVFEVPTDPSLRKGFLFDEGVPPASQVL